MKRRIIIIQSVVIVALLIPLVNNVVSLSGRKPVVREPETPGAATLSYTPPPSPKLRLETIPELLESRKRNFTPTVDKITEDIYLARGYMLGSIAMIITDEGLVLVDAGENRQNAAEVMKEFRKITNKPVKVIVYTHGHLDHVTGTESLAQDGTEIISTEIAKGMIEKDLGWLSPYHQRVRNHQFGFFHEEYAIARPFDLPFKPDREAEIILPTLTFKKEYTFELGGKRFELRHTTGETPGHLTLWLPDDHALFCGDQFYESFPNLSSPMLEPRPVKGWITSLEEMSALKPRYLIPSHTVAITGKENVQQVLNDRTEAIKYVYDETVNAMNNGLSVEQAVASISLLENLVNSPQLRELYGTVAWSVRGIYQGETGWYTGNGSDLNPLPDRFQAREIVKLVGGANTILARAVELQEAGEHQLVCELTDVVISANPEDRLARIIKSFSLDYLGVTGGNINSMGFYRSAAARERMMANYRLGS